MLRHVSLCYATGMRCCYPLQCSACNAMRCSAMQCEAMQRNAMRGDAMRWMQDAMWCNGIWCSAGKYGYTNETQSWKTPASRPDSFPTAWSQTSAAQIHWESALSSDELQTHSLWSSSWSLMETNAHLDCTAQAFQKGKCNWHSLAKFRHCAGGCVFAGSLKLTHFAWVLFDLACFRLFPYSSSWRPYPYCLHFGQESMDEWPTKSVCWLSWVHLLCSKPTSNILKLHLVKERSFTQDGLRSTCWPHVAPSLSVTPIVFLKRRKSSRRMSPTAASEGPIFTLRIWPAVWGTWCNQALTQFTLSLCMHCTTNTT